MNKARTSASDRRPSRRAHRVHLIGRVRSALALGLFVAVLTSTSTSAYADPTSSQPTVRPAVTSVEDLSCPQTPAPGHATCLSQAVSLSESGTGTRTGRAHPLTTASSDAIAYTAANLRRMYNVPPVTGSPEIAIVVAGHYSDIKTSMDYYRTQMGLPACTSCFTEFNQDGQQGPYPTWSGTGWGGETLLDVEMVSAICPTCYIDLIEADSNSSADLDAAVKVAARFAHWVSMSWGSAEVASDVNRNGTTFVDYSTRWHDVFVAGTGDEGYGADDLLFPGTSPNVVAVGGAAPLPDSTSPRGYSESAWHGAGSGCSQFQPQPYWQAAIPAISQSCSTRAAADVSAVAGSNTDQTVGVRVWSNSIGWAVYTGTSVAAPIIATLYAIAGNSTSPLAPYTNAAAHPEWVNDVTGGSTLNCPSGTGRLCTAAAGWDGPTGVGTPANVNLFLAPGATPIVYPSVTVNDPGSQSTVAGTGVDLAMTASTSNFSSPSESYTWAATGLPAGVTISSSTGEITGAPSTVGTYSVSVSATGSSSGAVGTTTFTWVVDPSPHVVTISAASQSGRVGVGMGTQVAASTSNLPGGESYTWTAVGLPAGVSISPSTGRISGTPLTQGFYTSTVTATGTISQVSGTTSVAWDIEAATPPPTTSPGTPVHTVGPGKSRALRVAKVGKVKGQARAGKTVKAVLPKLTTTTGQAVTGVTGKIAWYVNGHLVKTGAKKLRLKAAWRHKKLTFKATYAASASYDGLVFTSAKTRVK